MIINYITSLAIVFCSIFLLSLFGLIKRSKTVLELVFSTTKVIQDNELSDFEKQVALQKNAKTLLNHFFNITLGSMFAIFIPIALIWIIDYFNLLSFSDIISTLISPTFIVILFILSIVFFIITRRNDESNLATQYSKLDKLLHRLAFGSIPIQISFSKIEDRIYNNRLKYINLDKPVFVSGLPRAGTTILLDLLMKSKKYEAHTYRSMPFLLIPLIWRKFSTLFRNDTSLKERAHGDGIMINVDSHEAFEEVIWKAFWPSRYTKTHILPWFKTKYPDFEIFFRNHIKKVIYLKKSNDYKNIRYISKNNLNISRINYIHEIFPDAKIIVPFRSPLQHSASLLKQHKNFSNIHHKESFTREYMKDIGHYDFGDNLRPIDFNNWLSDLESIDANKIEFWLKYWIETYKYILFNNSSTIAFLSFDTLCNETQRTLESLEIFLDIKFGTEMHKVLTNITTPKKYNLRNDTISNSLIIEAESLYKKLVNASINRH